MKLGDLLIESRSDLAVVLECLVASASVSLSADDPSIVVCEDTCVLLVSAGICRDLTVLDVVLCESRIVEYETVLSVEVLVDRVESLDISSLVLTDLGHNCKALRLDEDLALFALLGAHLLAVSVVSSEEPVAVESRFHNVLLHLVDLSLSLVSLVILAEVAENANISRACVCKECSYHYGLCYL